MNTEATQANSPKTGPTGTAPPPPPAELSSPKITTQKVDWAQLSLKPCCRRNIHLSTAHLAVRNMPGSGSTEELLAWAGIDADHIAAAARDLIGAS